MIHEWWLTGKGDERWCLWQVEVWLKWTYETVKHKCASCYLILKQKTIRREIILCKCFYKFSSSDSCPLQSMATLIKNCVGTSFCVHPGTRFGVFKQAANSATNYQDIGPKDFPPTPCFPKGSVSNNFLPHCSQAQAKDASDMDSANIASHQICKGLRKTTNGLALFLVQRRTTPVLLRDLCYTAGFSCVQESFEILK